MILILLFFMFLVAKNAQDANKGKLDLEAICKQQLAACKADLSDAKNQLTAREKELIKLRQWVAILMNALGLKPLQPTDPGFDEDVQAKLQKGRGGIGKPNCLPSGEHLLDLRMEDGFITATKKWTAPDEPTASSVPAIQEAIDAGRISFSAFEAYAGKIAGGKRDCLFSVVVTDKTTRKETYKPQLLTLERFFRRRVMN
jgi:hypothetical protein